MFALLTRQRVTMLFQYTHIDAQSIRLVRFHRNTTSSDVHLVLEQQNRYWEDAVHYISLACISKDDEKDSVTLNGRSRLVPLAVKQALKHLFEHDARAGRYWVSSVCINHGNEAEKEQQYSQKSRIYSSADKLIIWLDTREKQSMTALATICKYPQLWTDPERESVESLSSKLSAWQIQTFGQTSPLQHRNAVLICGKYESSLDAYRQHAESQKGLRSNVSDDGKITSVI